MRRTRVRRPLPWLPLTLLLLLPAVWGCDKLPGSSGASGSTGASAAAGSAGEAERTRAMEEKAAEIERMAEEIRTMEGSEQEKIDAVNRLDEARRELERMQEDGPGQ
jgi:hypothetical protein